MTIAITAPTGNIGSSLVKHLLAANADLILLLRNPDKLDPSVRSRVKTAQGELQDAAFVQRATEGVETLFWLTPSDPTTSDLRAWYDRMGANAAQAVQSSGIARVVNLSSAGAQLPKAGPVSGLGQVEKNLNATSAAIVHLRPGYFMENALMQLDSLRHRNSLFAPGAGDVPFPQIATRDIAEAAARLLLDPAWTGQRIHGLHGPADLTFDAAVSIFSAVTGREIRYVPIPPEQALQAFLGMGLSPAFAEGYLDMYASLAQPGAVAEPRTLETTTPTTLERWTREVLKPALDTAA